MTRFSYDADAVEKVLKKGDGQGLKALKDLRPLLDAVTDWKHAAIEAAVNDYCTKTSLGLGKVAQPIRVAISGNTDQPADLRDAGVPRQRERAAADRQVHCGCGYPAVGPLYRAVIPTKTDRRGATRLRSACICIFKDSIVYANVNAFDIARQMSGLAFTLPAASRRPVPGSDPAPVGS